MPRRKRVHNQINLAVRDIRLASRLTQEDFSLVSSRTYMSSIERGAQNPTVSKIEELSEVLDVHPLTVLTLSYLKARNAEALKKLVSQVEQELESLGLLASAGESIARPKGIRRSA